MINEEVLQVGVVGAVIEAQVVEWSAESNQEEVVDMSSATDLVMKVQRPDNTIIARTALLSNDGTDGLVYIATVVGDLTMHGTYMMQVSFTLSNGWSGPSRINSFEVEPNLGN